MTVTRVARETGLCPPPVRRLGRAASLSDMLVQIDRATRPPSSHIDAVLADILGDFAHDPALLAGFDLAPSAERYARHLIHQGDGYSVLAIVWMPGQMSPVHSHRTWCVLAAHRGWLAETIFRHGRDDVEPVGCRQLFPGEVSHAPVDLSTAHRMANLGTVPAVSIHIYGAAYERLAQEVNQVWTA